MDNRITTVEYPQQICCVKRPDKTLGIDAKLSVPTADEINSGKKQPLEMHSNFSVFKFNMIIKDKTVPVGMKAVVVSANIPAVNMAAIYDKAKVVANMMAQRSVSPQSSDTKKTPTSLAYTKKLSVRKFGNKTPAEVLIEDPSKRADLINTQEWLKQNLKSYPANQVQIDAIQDAINLLDAGKLNAEEASANTNKSIVIYDSGLKMPHSYTVDEHGCTDVYTMSITCEPDKMQPYQIKIMNCSAPPVKKSTGMVSVSLSQARNRFEGTMNLTEEEWSHIYHQMMGTLKNFEAMNFPTQWNTANKYTFRPTPKA